MLLVSGGFGSCVGFDVVGWRVWLFLFGCVYWWLWCLVCVGWFSD